MAERQLYPLISSIVDATDIRVRPARHAYHRVAYVTTRSQSEAVALVAELSARQIESAPALKATIAHEKNELSDRHVCYTSMERNLRPPYPSIPPEVILSHLPPLSPRLNYDLRELFEALRLSPRDVTVTRPNAGMTPVAFVRLESHDECKEAILKLDGQLMEQCAIRVHWSIPRSFGGSALPPPPERGLLSLADFDDRAADPVRADRFIPSTSSSIALAPS